MSENSENQRYLIPSYYTPRAGCSYYIVSANPRFKFNPLFYFLYFKATVSFKISEMKTNIDLDKISEEIFQIKLRTSCWDIAFQFHVTPDLANQHLNHSPPPPPGGHLYQRWFFIIRLYKNLYSVTKKF